MSVSVISSWRVKYRPAMKREASTFPVASSSLISNSFSIWAAVDSVIIGACSFSIMIGRVKGF